MTTIPLDLPGGAFRRPAGPADVPWTCDAAVPPGIKEVARRLGARAARCVRGLIVVVLADRRECWLNLAGEQVGRDASGGRVPILDDVPWPMASVGERVGSAA